MSHQTNIFRGPVTIDSTCAPEVTGSRLKNTIERVRREK
jgi:hypothetical protein